MAESNSELMSYVPRIKILWVSHLVPYPPRAGVLLRSYNLLKQVSKYHEVHLVSFVQLAWMTTFYPSVEVGLAEAERELGKFCWLRGWVSIPREQDARYGQLWLALRSLLSRQCYTVNWLRSATMERALHKLMEEGGWDLIHFDTISLAQYRRIFGRIPATLGHHNIESHMMLRRARAERDPARRAYFWLEAKRLARYENAVARDFSVHITCSSLDSERLTSLAPDVEVMDVPNGVDCDFFRPLSSCLSGCGDEAGKRYDLLFVGTMDWYPNEAAMDHFLKVIWPKLLERRPDTTFGIVGSNPTARLLLAAESTRGVTVHGYVNDVRPFLQSTKIYVCPIRDGGGTKLKILDALAMECCVVAHPVACEGIAVRDGKTVRLASEPMQFVSAILDLLQDCGRRREMGVAGRALVQSHYSYETIGLQLANLFATAAHRRI